MNAVELRASNLFLSHYGFVSGMAFRYAPLPGADEDIVQQVFMEFITGARRWDLESDIRPLLVRMTQNIAKRYWREKLKQMPEVLQSIAERALRVAEKNEEPSRFAEESSALKRCIEKLPEKSRTLIRDHYFEGVSMREIAERKQATDTAVRRAFCDLRKKLYDCILRSLKDA